MNECKQFILGYTNKCPSREVRIDKRGGITTTYHATMWLHWAEQKNTSVAISLAGERQPTQSNLAHTNLSRWINSPLMSDESWKELTWLFSQLESYSRLLRVPTRYMIIGKEVSDETYVETMIGRIEKKTLKLLNFYNELKGN